MCSIKINPPAHLDLIPKEPIEIEQIDSNIRKILGRAFPNAQNVRRLNIGQEPFTLYTIEGQAKKYVVKLIPTQSYNRYSMIANITGQFTKQSGVVNALNKNLYFQESIPAYIQIYPYIPGGYLNAEPNAFIAVGKSLASFHDQLLSCPLAHQIEVATKKRLAELEAHSQQAYQPNNGDSEAQQLFHELYEFREFIEFYPERQAIHGDLNSGNVLYNDGRAYFLDYEEILTSHFTPLVDIARLIERALLVRKLSPEIIYSCATSFIRSYLSHSRNKLFFCHDAIYLTLKWYNYYSISNLLFVAYYPDDVYKSELIKFQTINKIIENYKSLLSEIQKSTTC